MDYAELVARSRALPYSFPTEANRVAHFAARAREVEEHAAGVRPVVPARLLPLIEAFLTLKRARGSEAERAVYGELDTAGLISRLLQRRPLAFLNPQDTYLLRDGTRGTGGFELVGGRSERHPFALRELQSYDEMALAALIGVSVPTHFLNAGGRQNRAQPGPAGSFEERGVYVGLVGARFERPEEMEWRHLLVTPQQNLPPKGYGPDADPELPATALLRAWAEFYGRDHLPTYAEAMAAPPGRYLETGLGLLDTALYRQRIRITAELFLREADARAEAAGRRAYAHVVGLGLGVWRVHPRQVELMVEAYAEVLENTPFLHLADLDFSWFAGVEACGGARSGELFGGGEAGVRIHFSRRDPAAKLTGEDAGKLLVAMYAWDSNSFPGNEYWLGSLSASGDPAAACCSTIPELQNPDLNPRVSGTHAAVLPSGGQGGPDSV